MNKILVIGSTNIDMIACVKHLPRPGETVGEARTMLTALSWPQEVIDRVCYLVGHHHTYDNIDGMDYQILVEADFLVNLFEDGSTPDTQKSVFERIFRTEGGKRLFRLMFESGEE